MGAAGRRRTLRTACLAVAAPALLAACGGATAPGTTTQLPEATQSPAEGCSTFSASFSEDAVGTQAPLDAVLAWAVAHEQHTGRRLLEAAWQGGPEEGDEASAAYANQGVELHLIALPGGWVIDTGTVCAD